MGKSENSDNLVAVAACDVESSYKHFTYVLNNEDGRREEKITEEVTKLTVTVENKGLCPVNVLSLELRLIAMNQQRDPWLGEYHALFYDKESDICLTTEMIGNSLEINLGCVECKPGELLVLKSVTATAENKLDEFAHSACVICMRVNYYDEDWAECKSAWSGEYSVDVAVSKWCAYCNGH